MTDSRQITRAGLDDWDVIWPIWHEIVAAGDTYAYDPTTSYEQAREMWLGPAEAEVWRLLENGNVLGGYRISPNHHGPGAHVANGSYMVGSAARGRGVGRALVEHSLARAAEVGYLGIQFNAVAVTNVDAIGLYHRLGFATVGTIPLGFRHPQQGLVDLLIMYRDL